jgi:hypothetical protein
LRIKPDGSLDYRPAPNSSHLPPTPIWDQLTVEQQRQWLIEYLLRARPQLTPEEAAEQIDNVF